MIEVTDEDRFLTPAEAAAYVRRSIRTLARMRAEGRGPSYHQHGNKVLYALSSLRAWMFQNTVTPNGISL